MCFTPQAFQAELEFWRVVIHLNLCRLTIALLDGLETSSDGPLLWRDRSQSAVEDAVSELRRLRMRLSPLRSVERTINKVLVNSAEVQDGRERARKTGFSEVTVMSGSRWKSAIVSSQNRRTGTSELTDANHVLLACADDMDTLWRHSETQKTLRDGRILLAEQSNL
jgi:hypothetical protein